MKKQLLTLALFLGATVAQAQSNIIKLNTVSLLARTGSFFFEHKLNDTKSLNFGIFSTNYQENHPAVGLYTSDKTSLTGFGLTGEYRFYLSDNALRGFFIGPYLRFQHYDISEEVTYIKEYLNGATRTDKGSLNTVGGGAVMGAQWLVKSRISIEPFIGFGYAAGSVKNDSSNGGGFHIHGGIQGLELRPGINIGYAFGKAAE
jgi:hypothetical protein